MIKTTIFLSEDLKAALKRVATEAGSTEAEIIREGIRLVVTRYRPPTFGIFASGEPNFSDRVDELVEGFGEP